MPEQLGVFGGGDGTAGGPACSADERSATSPTGKGGAATSPADKGAAAHPAGKRSARGGAGLGARVPAAELPVARVAVDVGHAHLDRPFDYLVPQEWADTAVAGARVRVRFAGRLVDGFILGRCQRSEHAGKLAFLERVVSGEPVLAPEVADLARAVADRYAGTLADVLRLAVPPRHARAEKESVTPLAAQGETSPPVPVPVRVPAGRWSDYPDGAQLLAALAAGGSPRAVWWALPGPSWPAMVAAAVQATVSSGRGALVVVPDHRDVDRVAGALGDALGAPASPPTAGQRGAGQRGAGQRAGQRMGEGDLFVTLSADLGPAERYRRFLAIRRGAARVVVGTRAAVFAPVADLGLIIVWDDGDDLHAEPRSPYPHVRDVAVLRSRQQRSALIIGGWSPSAEAEAMVRVGWAASLTARRPAVRAAAALVRATGSDFEEARDPAARAARLPSPAWGCARDALAAGNPVLVQVPRRGYQPSLACAGCRRPARCGHCRGPLGRTSAAGLVACTWCGRPASVPAAVPPISAVPLSAVPPVAPAYADPQRRSGRVTGGPAGVSVAGERAAGGWSGGDRPGGDRRADDWSGGDRSGWGWRCLDCGHDRLRVSVVGHRRTAEELGRAFPGVSIRTSGRDSVLATVPAGPSLVIATPGAEPVADGGYGAVLLLDTWALLGRPDLRAAEETLRRWCAAAALARSATDGGVIVVVADAALPVVQALTRWDPGWFIRRETDERADLGFPPATRIAAVEGAPGPVAEFVAVVELPPGAEVLGPVPVDDPARPSRTDRLGDAGHAGAGGAAATGGADDTGHGRERVLIRVPRAAGQQLAAAVKAARGVLDAGRSGPVRVVLDPVTLV